MRFHVQPGERHLTKQAFVYQAIRGAILRCELAPGERLIIDELANDLKVSRIPVREALQVLQSEGLVVTIPHARATVAPISQESVFEVFTVMEGLEVVATRVAAQRAGPSGLADLEEIMTSMDRALEGGRHDHWADLNTRFHLTVSRLAGLPLLQDLTERALDRWDRVRRFYFKGVLVHRATQAQKEHREILVAMKVGDLERLEEEVRQHNRGALRDYRGYMNDPSGES